jgi:hypothetical protein
MRTVLLVLLAVHAGAALAQYKCTAAGGAITFQQTPCPGSQKEEKLVVIPNGHPPLAPGAAPAAPQPEIVRKGLNLDERMLAGYEKAHRRESVAQALRTAQDEKARRSAQRLEDIAAARRRIGDDPANAKALRDALDAIDSRYQALGEIDDQHVRAAQEALAAWDKDNP